MYQAIGEVTVVASAIESQLAFLVATARGRRRFNVQRLTTGSERA